MDHQDVLSKMTEKDKIALCSGQNAWSTKAMAKYGIPAMVCADGPHGLRVQEPGAGLTDVHRSRPATCFPAAALTACSWDPALLEEMGRAIGTEAESSGVDLVLGPGANLKRDPRCGRNFEYFSEDPLLSGALAAGEIAGIQKTGVGACLKHFVCNNQEYRRTASDSRVDERTLRELYLTAFEIAVREAKPAAVMAAYNMVNGIYCSDHKELLTDILRHQWGYEGLVVTDWGGMHDRVAAFEAGCDLSMPGKNPAQVRAARRAVNGGRLSREAVDESAARILKLALRERPAPGQTDWAAHHRLAARMVRESAVLLQNKDQLLPLSPEQNVVLMGAMAASPRIQGTGSSHVHPVQLTGIRDALPGLSYVPGCREDGSTDEMLLAEAARAASQAQTVVIFAGFPEQAETEGADRRDLKMPEGQLRLIETVSAVNPNTVVVLTSGGPVECPWAEHVKSILYVGLPGQACGEAIGDLIYGRANPCGRLAESWPIRLEDCPTAAYYGAQNAQYREGIYVGYRYYEKAGVPVRWAFGHGLSYTTFAYSDLRLIGDVVTVSVTNTGDRPGAEVAQLYIAPPAGGIHRPIRELKGFLKVKLEPGQTKTLGFQLEERSFALWQGGWVVPGGVYTATVGGLSVDIPRQGPELPVPQWQPGSWYEHPCGCPKEEDWKMLGRFEEKQETAYSMDSTLTDLAQDSRLAAMLARGICWYLTRQLGEDDPLLPMLLQSSLEASLCSVQSNAGLPRCWFELLVKLANRKQKREAKSPACNTL